MTAHEVLVKARNLIEREGWVQGASWRPQEGYCSTGAISEVAVGSPFRLLALDKDLRDELRGALDKGRVVEWNNAPGRTKAEVLAAFDEAIRRTAPPPADPLPRESYEGYCERTRREWDEPKAVPVP